VLINFVIGLFNGTIKRTIEQEVAKIVTQAINVRVNQVLATLPISASVGSGVSG
jgi:hypothetical protein